MAVYLELFHGRASTRKRLHDWGTEGPIFGPLAYVHTTYATDIKIETSDGQSGVLRLMGEDEPDLLYYDNVYYGDWSVFSDEVLLKNEALAVRVQSFETAKATPPSVANSNPEQANDDGSTVAWRMNIPVLSTTHIQPATLEQLAALRPELVADYPEGAFIHIGTLSPAELRDLPELLPILDWFQKNYPDEKWLRLDRDGDIVEEMPQFQW